MTVNSTGAVMMEGKAYHRRRRTTGNNQKKIEFYVSKKLVCLHCPNEQYQGGKGICEDTCKQQQDDKQFVHYFPEKLEKRTILNVK